MPGDPIAGYRAIHFSSGTVVGSGYIGWRMSSDPLASPRAIPFSVQVVGNGRAITVLFR
jgi:hypothetical protein